MFMNTHRHTFCFPLWVDLCDNLEPRTRTEVMGQGQLALESSLSPCGCRSRAEPLCASRPKKTANKSPSELVREGAGSGIGQMLNT